MTLKYILRQWKSAPEALRPSGLIYDFEENLPFICILLKEAAKRLIFRTAFTFAIRFLFLKVPLAPVAALFTRL